jgi:hypothetical protein
MVNYLFFHSFLHSYYIPFELSSTFFYFVSAHGKELQEMIEKETGGDFQKLLVELIKVNGISIINVVASYNDSIYRSSSKQLHSKESYANFIAGVDSINKYTLKLV